VRLLTFAGIPPAAAPGILASWHPGILAFSHCNLHYLFTVFVFYFRRRNNSKIPGCQEDKEQQHQESSRQTAILTALLSEAKILVSVSIADLRIGQFG
jgi:hypothetical protein